MLVLSRRIREQILIPELNITITVLSVGVNRVQLGIQAPKHIDITRPEAGRPARSDVPEQGLTEAIDSSVPPFLTGSVHSDQDLQLA